MKQLTVMLAICALGTLLGEYTWYFVLPHKGDVRCWAGSPGQILVYNGGYWEWRTPEQIKEF